METPIQIDFEGMQGRPDVRDSIEKHVAELERRYGRVTAGRVQGGRERSQPIATKTIDPSGNPQEQTK